MDLTASEIVGKLESEYHGLDCPADEVPDPLKKMKVCTCWKSHLPALREKVEDMERGHPKCTSCGEPASCLVATCEGVFGLEYGCDECCGHGNEDMYCRPLGQEAEVFAYANQFVRDVHKNYAHDFEEIRSTPPAEGERKG